ncbi:MAG TPA: 4'-phosphopantetheinyl transferase superfamily protein [Jiangellales bacterium]|nr:4'-phosphopantetheinyl transferase superfamily protein [Jiangellales bacterium]
MTPSPVRTGVGGEAHCEVWWSAPSGDPALLHLLDETELHRAVRLAHRKDRDRYVTAHALARLLLGELTGEDPARLRFDRTCRRCGDPEHGKPQLVGRATPFSLAHSGDRVVVAVVDSPAAGLDGAGLESGVDVPVDVGVDVERVSAQGELPATLSREVLATAELTAYDRLDEHERARAIAVWWTRKESVLKATGDGLAVPPALVEVTPPWCPPALVGALPAAGHLRRRAWSSVPPAIALHELDAGTDHVGCVAVLGVQTVRVSEREAPTLLHGAM